MRAGRDSDEALMLRYRGGDVAAFEALYQRHRGPLFRHLHRQCSNRSTAEELFQDVWMNVIGARERYQVQAKFATFLYRIAHNRLVDYYRASQRRAAELSGLDAEVLDRRPADAGAHPEQQLESRRRLERLQALIQALPVVQREAFLLREEAGLGIEQIAEVTGVGKETAKSRLRYAVSKLRRGLGCER